MNYIKTFAELGKDDAAIAGGKGASLGEMTQAGIPVPPGYVVLSEAFEHFLKATDLNVEIDAILKKVEKDEMRSVEHASEKIQSHILRAKMPEDIAVIIKDFFKQLDTEYVAVRSSATAEDSSSAAWAGQLDSFLNTSEATLLENVQRCWASLFTPRAIFYRFEKNLDTTKISVAVVVQKMVESEYSGIAFSVHPVTEDRNQLIIEAGFGLGEAIVSGQITPDSYVVGKTPRAILDANANTQTRALYRVEGGGNEWRDIPEPQASTQVLTEKQILELSELIIHIENHYGFPCDIEWAFEEGRFYIVQSRPITTLQEIATQVLKDGDLVEVDADNGVVRILSKYESLDEYSHTPIKENVEISYEEFCSMYKKNEWVKVGNWKVPTISLDVFNCSQSTYYLSFYNITDIPPIKYLQVGTDVYVSKKELGIIKEKIFAKLDSTDSIFLKEFDAKLIEARKELAESIQVLIEMKEISHDALRDVFERLFTVLSAFEIARDLSSYLEEYISKRFEETGLAPIPLPELLEQDKETDAYKLEQEIHILRTNGYTEDDLSNLVCHFGYLKQYFLSGDGYTEADLEKMIQTSEEEKEAENHVQVIEDAKLRELIKTMNRFAVVRLLNNESGNKAMYMLKPVLKKIACDFNMTYDSVLSLPVDEILQVIKKEYSHIPFLKKNSDTALISTNKNYLLKEGELAKFKNEFFSFSHEEIRELLGTSTYKGVVRGAVRIISSDSDFDTFNEGEVLVCSMTDPNYVSLMKKASAFVTDMGGILCHAAIISRELKKPCIIGTKIATQVLKDGDLVEVDADNGVVRVLENAKKETEQVFTKAYTRDFSIIIQQAWFAANKDNFLDKLGLSEYPYDPPYIYFMEDGVEEVWENVKANRWLIERLVEKIKDDVTFFPNVYIQYTERLKEIEKWFQKDLKSVDDLKNFIDIVFAGISDFVVLYGSLLDESISAEYKKLAKEFRKNDSLFSDCNKFIVNVLKKLYPEIGHLVVYITYDELGCEIYIDELKRRDSGFALIPGVYRGAIKFDELKSKFQEYKFQEEFGEHDEDGIKGQVAYKGNSVGRVRVLKRSDQVNQVVEGEVIVSPITTPDMLLAMRKAAAFVTDEGGVTCHAAIIARELKKPCIIGTKIATQVLKDGDLVEVDADNGVVRVLEKSEKGIQKYKKEDYVLVFWVQGVSVFVTDIHLDVYRELEVLYMIENGMFKQYFTKVAYNKALEQGLAFYSSESAFDGYQKDLSVHCHTIKKFFETQIKGKDVLSDKEVSTFFEYTKKLCGDYRKMNIEYTDMAFSRKNENTTTEKNLAKVTVFKDEVRAVMNQVLFEADGYVARLFSALGRQFNISPSVLDNLTQSEILDLFDGKRPDELIVLKRQMAFVESYDLNGFHEGEAALQVIQSFKEEIIDTDTIFGTTANIGKCTGKVKIIPVDYSNFTKINSEIEKMQPGEILVAQTTAPELITACKKAGAIVTDIGGLMSHSAIVSREFGIPCIVGTKIATQVLKDGDLVEVDADNGVVRILESGS